MKIVTGGAGFIGSNIVKALNDQGHKDVLVVDDLSDGRKFRNLVDCEVADYWDYQRFIDHVRAAKDFEAPIEVVFHEGACSTTTEWDGRYMMENNYEYSKDLLHYCTERSIPYIYASSAAVYGGGEIFQEERSHEAPLNVYGYSKFLFDQYVRARWNSFNSQVVGLRYFNVYGPRESHKDGMASVAFHFNNQIKSQGVVKLFEGCDGYDDGEQKRDFVFVDDVVNINLWLWKHPQVSGIYNAGSGSARPFNAVADAVIAWHAKGEKQYIPFPDNLKGCYQSFTQADMSALLAQGYDIPFTSVEMGVKKYLDWLNSDN